MVRRLPGSWGLQGGPRGVRWGLGGEGEVPEPSCSQRRRFGKARKGPGARHGCVCQMAATGRAPFLQSCFTGRGSWGKQCRCSAAPLLVTSGRLVLGTHLEPCIACLLLHGVLMQGGHRMLGAVAHWCSMGFQRCNTEARPARAQPTLPGNWLQRSMRHSITRSAKLPAGWSSLSLPPSATTRPPLIKAFSISVWPWPPLIKALRQRAMGVIYPLPPEIASQQGTLGRRWHLGR